MKAGKIILWLLVLAGVAAGQRHPNTVILEVIGEMPKGGGYSVEKKAKRSLDALRAAIRCGENRLGVDPETARPSFCSSATYVVLLEALERMRIERGFAVDGKAAQLWNVVKDQADGEGVWGRWNANGPGAAKLLHDTGMGWNFEDWGRARPGDFLKIFWTDEIGAKEFGHLVVYLGRRTVGGEERVRFWSSNQPGGYGVKEVPRRKIKWAVFSRLEWPERVGRVTRLRKTDGFLADMLRKRFTRDEVRKAVGVRE